MSVSYDVVIAGGGVMGSSVAYWLSKLAGDTLKIAVVERDKSYAQSATALSAASTRLQFSNRINIKISRFGIDFIKNIEAHLGTAAEIGNLGFQENGYLFLAGTDAQAQTMREVVQIQNDEGAKTQLIPPDLLRTQWPWLNTKDVSLGSFGPENEGWFDNMGLLWGFRRAARAAGVDYIDDEVQQFHHIGSKISGLQLAKTGFVSCNIAINCCGTHAASFMRDIGQSYPVEPRKRTVFVIDAPNAKAHNASAPLLIDHTGFYLRPEGSNWIVATVPEHDKTCDIEDYEPDLHEFEDIIWERLYNRSEAFDAVKVIRAWAGQYDYNTLDQNAVVGRWPSIDNLFILNGFSGHGLQQAPALGRGMAELIASEQYVTLDLSELSPERILSQKPFLERAIV